MERSIMLVVTALMTTAAYADPAVDAAQEQHMEEIRQRQWAEINHDMQHRLDALIDDSFRPESEQDELISGLSAEELLLQARSQ
ncbi:MAG: hypothetical protein ACR2QG_09450 [Gammaproteobacteria bacterium]